MEQPDGEFCMEVLGLSDRRRSAMGNSCCVPRHWGGVGAGEVCNPSTQVKTGGLDAQDYPWLHHEFKASLGFMRFCFNSKNNNSDDRGD